MNTNMLFTNEDIITELWKHIKVDTMKKLSIVSKDFNTCYKNMSDINILTRKYKESESLSTFILATSKEVIKTYRYPTAKFIPIICSFFDKKISKEEKVGIDNDIYLIYYWIILLYHTVNNNYTEILNVIKKIDYTRKLDPPIIYLFLNFMDQTNVLLYGSSYSLNKLMLMRVISFSYLVLFSKFQFRKHKKFVDTVLSKQNMVIQQIKTNEIYLGNLYPKRFCKELIDILEK